MSIVKMLFYQQCLFTDYLISVQIFSIEGNIFISSIILDNIWGKGHKTFSSWALGQSQNLKAP